MSTEALLFRKALSDVLTAEEHVIEQLADLEYVRSLYGPHDARRKQVEFAYTSAMLVHKHALCVARDLLAKHPAP